MISSTEEGVGIVTDENGVKGRWIESDLPDAMRIWKPREARSVTVPFLITFLKLTSLLIASLSSRTGGKHVMRVSCPGLMLTSQIQRSPRLLL